MRTGGGDASEVVNADVCIVGAGVAGLFAALTLPEGTDAVVLDQGRVGQGSSPYAQGGMAAAVGPEDDPERHLEDTIAAGAGLVDVAAAEVLCREAPARVTDLIALGCAFDRTDDGSIHLAREGGQSVARSVHTADATGAEMMRALREAARARVRRVEGYATEVILDGERVAGVLAVAGGRWLEVRARATLLATGGAGALFASTTNPPASTGTAIAIAHDAGARVADLEFVQFHPTSLAVAESPRPLITEALRGAGARLVNARGERFMVGLHPDAELAPRHVVTAAILAEGEAFLDARHLSEEAWEREFPTVLKTCRERGVDPVTQLLPVAPAAHYLIGGVQTDLEGRSSLPGLWAAGECAATGVHGANRMAGNSLAEAVVFGRRAALSITASLPDLPPPPASAAGHHRAITSADPVGPAPRELVEATTLGAGPIRDAASSREALERLEALARQRFPHDAPGMAIRLAVRTATLLVRSALAREETRGVHLRRDHPERAAAMEGAHITHTRTEMRLNPAVRG